MPIITPVGAPALANSRAPTQSDAKERAVAAFKAASEAAKAPQSQEHPVSNPTQVSPEEVSAVTQSTRSEQQTEQTISDETPESGKAATEPPVKEEKPLSSQYAVLARKEKALRAKVQQQEQAMRQREADFAKREEAVKAKEAEYNSNFIPKSRLVEDPLTSLLEAGVTYDDLTQKILNQSQAQADPATKLAIQKLEQQLKQQNERLEQADKAREEQIKGQYNEALKQIRMDASKLVKADPSFELIRETGSVGDVVELIEKTYNQDGVILSVEEAAQAVEEYLTDRLSKYAKTGKIQRLLQPKQAQSKAAPAQAPVTRQQQSQVKTLTNAMNSSKPMSARDRAVLAFKGQLK